MNELKITQGDWKALLGSDGFKSCYFIVAEQEHKTVDICKVFNDNDDAKILAASKELYEALKEQEDYLKSIKYLFDSLQTDEAAKRVFKMHYTSIEDLRNRALEKVEGKDSGKNG